MMKFQHTAARRRLGNIKLCELAFPPVSTHSRPKAAGIPDAQTADISLVSTHSRPKAAGRIYIKAYKTYRGFNTQPPEGGWKFFISQVAAWFCFNTQPPEGGWSKKTQKSLESKKFQHTAARRRLEDNFFIVISFR